MALGLALIIILGLGADYLFRRMQLPGLVGMLLAGVLAGPYVLGLFDLPLSKTTHYVTDFLLQWRVHVQDDPYERRNDETKLGSHSPDTDEDGRLARQLHFFEGLY